MIGLNGVNVRVAVGPEDYGQHIAELLSDLPFPVCPCKSLEELVNLEPTAVVLDGALLSAITIEALREALPGVPLLAAASICSVAEFPLPEPLDKAPILKLVRIACELHLARTAATQSRAIATTAEVHLTQLAEIGVALSAERDLNTLLKRILEAAQDIACCDGASLFLINSESEAAELVFKLTLNDSIDVPFGAQRFAVDTRSISGYVAETGEDIHCEDVYLMGPEQPFRFNPQFDRQTGYRTRSLYCVPMSDNKGQVVGVLQFINRKENRQQRVTPETIDTVVRDFDEPIKKSLQALASLSAIALQTRKLLDDINNLFENFVQASVVAIEQRDPTTSGHSFRVADLSVALAQNLNTATRSDLARFNPSAEKLRELRYASLLHDFGKVGVRESVLVKSKKLFSGDLTELRYRLALTRQRLRAEAAEKIITLHERGMGEDTSVNEIRLAFKKESQQLDHFLKLIVESNEPSILDQAAAHQLSALNHYQCDLYDGEMAPLLSSQGLEALSVPRGSLTKEERLEIESHVVHTYNFLKLIPWTGDLAGIPDIAGRHHEKLDGSGYPGNLEATDIPMQSRIMTICDIFDALTASDRPYKQAMPENIAFRILREDAHRGVLDPGIVEVFIGADVASATRGKEYPKAQTLVTSTFFNSVCDPDLHADHSGH
jgi:HD-GYP domain-containing protein (c-di-GMP phosphodiesterase class II)